MAGALIVNYEYKLDDYEKTKELADMLACRFENEPANAAMTVIDAQVIFKHALKH